MPTRKKKYDIASLKLQVIMKLLLRKLDFLNNGQYVSSKMLKNHIFLSFPGWIYMMWSRDNAFYTFL